MYTTGFYDKKEVMEIMTESMKMREFNHPHVLGLIGVCIDAGPAPYIVMPFMANGSLLSYFKKERPNLLLDETTDEDLVRPNCFWANPNILILYSQTNQNTNIYELEYPSLLKTEWMQLWHLFTQPLFTQQHH